MINRPKIKFRGMAEEAGWFQTYALAYVSFYEQTVRKDNVADLERWAADVADGAVSQYRYRQQTE